MMKDNEFIIAPPAAAAAAANTSMDLFSLSTL